MILLAMSSAIPTSSVNPVKGMRKNGTTMTLLLLSLLHYHFFFFFLFFLKISQLFCYRLELLQLT